MEHYKQYLAQKLLTEDQLVTYRLLSRALGVHVNLAKEMLYDFHKWQNDKRPGTLHATYIIYGTKARTAETETDGDVEMTDSHESEDVDAPFSDLVPTYTLSLVSQEQFEQALSQYSEVTSIHVYSLAPHPLKDLQLLTDTARQVLELSKADSAPKPSRVYGTIANPNVRRRERRGGPAPATQAHQPKSELKVPIKQEVKPAAAPAAKEEPKTSSKPASASAPVKKSTPAASLKRQASSGIGQMFAKAAANPKKPASKASQPAAADSQATGALSDDGEDDAEPAPEVKVKQDESAAARQARKDRQAELRRMMEESDDDEAEKEEAEESPDPEADPMDEEPEPEPEPEQEPEPGTTSEEPAEVVSSAAGGRRRGRRRVTRKKQIMDEKGYLVTIQEQGWESFSEDEAPPPPPVATRPKQQQSTPPGKSEPATKQKKGAAGKGAQGSITSFFSKK